METKDIDILLKKSYEEYNNGNYGETIQLLKTIMHEEKKVSFWYYSRLSSCYYELKDYENALGYAKIAYKMKPKSPLVLWDYAGVLIMVKKEKRAIELLKRIQEMEDDFTVYKFEKSLIKWMQSIKNDANFQIGHAYYIIREDRLAKDYYLKHLSQRKKGLKSIYSKKQVLSYLKKLNPDIIDAT